jgi:hypothetical protein
LGLGALVIATAFAPNLSATIPDVEVPSIGRVVLVGRFACADRCDGDILYGDFDGDGWRDYAYPIKEIVDLVEGRCGIRVHLKNPLTTGREVMEIEAAAHGPNGPPDFSGVDFWRVVPRAELKRLWPGPIHPRGDGIVIEKRGSYSGLLGVVRGRLAWRWLRRSR